MSENDRGREQQQSIGYKKPPKHTQFKPGQSGNPNGRPKKQTRFSDFIAKDTSRKISMRVGDEEQRVSVLRAIGMQQIKLALSGNHKATALILNALKGSDQDPNNHLPELLSEFRSINARRSIERVRTTQPRKETEDSVEP